MTKNVYKALKDKHGSMLPFEVAILIAAMIISMGVLQAIKIYAYAGKAQAIMTDALTSCARNNYAGVYYGLRDGSTGAYLPDGRGSYTADVDEQKIENYLMNISGFTKKGSKYNKQNAGGSEMYSIEVVNIKVTNSTDASAKFTLMATFTVLTPLPVAGDALPYISIPMTVSGGYVTKY